MKDHPSRPHLKLPGDIHTHILLRKPEIGQEKAQSVIDSITSSYAAEGQTLPNPAMVPGAFPPPYGIPGMF